MTMLLNCECCHQDFESRDEYPEDAICPECEEATILGSISEEELDELEDLKETDGYIEEL